jgi:hypothetical protein
MSVVLQFQPTRGPLKTFTRLRTDLEWSKSTPFASAIIPGGLLSRSKLKLHRHEVGGIFTTLDDFFWFRVASFDFVDRPCFSGPTERSNGLSVQLTAALVSVRAFFAGEIKEGLQAQQQYDEAQSIQTVTSTH